VTTIILDIPPEPTGGIYCPRCDRRKKNWDELKTHVALQHPDHDPLWYETYPEAFGN
jgi:hypothetical protein